MVSWHKTDPVTHILCQEPESPSLYFRQFIQPSVNGEGATAKPDELGEGTVEGSSPQALQTCD